MVVIEKPVDETGTFTNEEYELAVADIRQYIEYIESLGREFEYDLNEDEKEYGYVYLLDESGERVQLSSYIYISED